MAHFAQIDDENTVINVIVIHNDELLDNGVEKEEKGIQFCKSLYGEETNWVQTSYNNNIRKNFAGIGFTYNPIGDYFYAPKPYDSWILNEDTAQWEAPTPNPSDSSHFYRWNEDELQWRMTASRSEETGEWEPVASD